MTTSTEKPRTASRWPSGLTFLLYCAGLSLLALVGYVVTHGEGFKFTAGTEGVGLESVKTPLNQSTVSVDSSTQAVRSKELDEQFQEATRTPAVAQTGPFNGRWMGNGSTYLVEQHGADVALQELTNGIVTSVAQGTAVQNQATLTAVNIIGLSFPIVITLQGKQALLSAFGNTFTLDPA
ncbi:MAG TPA: hypothetical protein VMG12_14100 [Polyangiaceae bacterium]|nr:hypothetical protein [Polyangiaceae bacterium]